ncbi:hypothetical protein EON66_08900, partial [archaeon]
QFDHDFSDLFWVMPPRTWVASGTARVQSQATHAPPVPLAPGGADKRVHHEERHAYVAHVVQAFCDQFRQQLGAIRRGFGTVLPDSVLSLFDWNELEVLVCGEATVDVALLRKHTRYDGYSAHDEVIERFWRVLASLSSAERCQYLRFVWGRSRLPPDSSAWTSTHTISVLSGGDAALPMSHTCFFQLDLPRYTTDERMRWGLRTAIVYSTGAILNA